jgi:hypothetical protein
MWEQMLAVLLGGLLYTWAVRKVKPSDGNKATLAPGKKGRGYVLEHAYKALLGAIRRPAAFFLTYELGSTHKHGVS